MPEKTEIKSQFSPSFNEIVWAKLLAVLQDIKDSILKILDYYIDREKGDSILEVYNLTPTTQEQKLFPPVDKNGKRTYWFWLQIDNFDTTNNVNIGINSSSQQGILLKAGESKTISYNNLKINYISYKSVSGSPSIQIICARPKFD